MSEEFNKFAKEMATKHGASIIRRASEIDKMEVLSTGSLGIDFAIGGGMPVGTMVELFGRAGVGKSSLSYYMIADAQRKGKNCVLVNIEGVYDKRWAEAIAGVDNEKLVIAQPRPGADTVKVMAQCVNNPAVDLLILDSIGAMLTDGEQEIGAAKQAGGQSGLVTHMVKQISQAAWPNRVCVVFINQVRSVFSAMHPIEDSPGGNAKEHQAAIRIHLKRNKDLATATVFGEKDIPVMYRVNANVKKIKVGFPNQKAGYNFWNYPSPEGVLGIDRDQEVIDAAFKIGIIDQRGAYYDHSSFPGGTVKSRDAVEELIRTDDAVKQAIRQEVLSFVPTHENIIQNIKNIKMKSVK